MKVPTTKTLLRDLRELITRARQDVARSVNSSLVMLYWSVGRRMRKEVLGEKRAGYGEEIVASVSRQLTSEFGSGFTEKSLRRMIQMAEVFPDEQIVATIGLESFCRDHATEERTAAGVLCGYGARRTRKVRLTLQRIF